LAKKIIKYIATSNEEQAVPSDANAHPNTGNLIEIIKIKTYTLKRTECWEHNCTTR